MPLSTVLRQLSQDNVSSRTAVVPSMQFAVVGRENYELPDPPLTELGLQQCNDLRASLQTQCPIINDIELIVTSPLRRTLQTTQHALSFLLARHIPVQTRAEFQENSAKPCDTGTPITTIAKEFPAFSFSTVSPTYPAKTGPFAFTPAAIAFRGYACLAWLRARPEKAIAIVSHSGFLRIALTHAGFANADWRLFRFDPKTPLPAIELVQGLESIPTGGMRRSWEGWQGMDTQKWLEGAEMIEEAAGAEDAREGSAREEPVREEPELAVEAGEAQWTQLKGRFAGLFDGEDMLGADTSEVTQTHPRKVTLDTAMVPRVKRPLSTEWTCERCKQSRVAYSKIPPDDQKGAAKVSCDCTFCGYSWEASL